MRSATRGHERSRDNGTRSCNVVGVQVQVQVVERGEVRNRTIPTQLDSTYSVLPPA